LAEHGFFTREMNTGWAEWVSAGLPTHADEHLERGTIRCGCSLHADLVARELREPDVHHPLAP